MNARTLRLALFSLAALTLALAGCHGFFSDKGPGPTGTIPKFAYVANNNGGGAGSVSAYTINASTGALAAVAGSPFPAVIGPPGTNAVGANTGGNFVYVSGSALLNNLFGFAINRVDGTLSAVPLSPYTVGTVAGLTGVAVDPSARFVYVADAGGSIFGFTVNGSTGALTPTVPASFATGGTPNGLYVDPSGRFVYATLGTSVAVFTIGSGGVLTPQAGSTLTGCAGFKTIVVDPTVHFAYLADGVANVCQFTVNTTSGVLSVMSPATIGAGAGTSAVVVDPTGKFAYAAGQAADNVSAYTINSGTGALTAITGSPFSTGVGTGPAALSAEPSGLFLYSANNASGTVSIFKINSSTGALGTPPASATAGTNPVSIVTTK